MNRLKVLLPNLSCASCVPEIEQVMRQQEGVIWAIVNFAAGEATIIYDAPAFNLSQLAQAVAQLGFQMVFAPDTGRRSQTGFMEPRPLVRIQQWMRGISHSFIL